MQLNAPPPILYTKDMKLCKVAGNSEVFAVKPGVPVHILIVDCAPKECSVTPIMDNDGSLDYFELRGCIIERNSGIEVRAQGSVCGGFTFLAVIKGLKFNLPCPHSMTLTVDVAVLKQTMGYFSGRDFLGETLRNNMIVNPMASERDKKYKKDVDELKCKHESVSRTFDIEAAIRYKASMFQHNGEFTTLYEPN
ncbi:UNVERIFIED_CONTAM: hypothetical protein HDU68_005297, partial [Siphonaria sp. JEL0065]